MGQPAAEIAEIRPEVPHGHLAPKLLDNSAHKGVAVRARPVARRRLTANPPLLIRHQAFLARAQYAKGDLGSGPIAQTSSTTNRRNSHRRPYSVNRQKSSGAR